MALPIHWQINVPVISGFFVSESTFFFKPFKYGGSVIRLKIGLGKCNSRGLQGHEDDGLSS